jgi:molybdopterin-containing oxidoreductase family iron-sulfur binding subunit
VPDVPTRPDLAAIRRRLSGSSPRDLWRSLDALADEPALAELIQRDFPRAAAGLAAGVDRRDFLRLMGASLAMAGLGACTRQPVEEIVPYVRQPEQLVPSQPLYYATAMPLAGFGLGLLVESHEGRPTKVEGNPMHPDSLGASDALAQASILTLYDPDRSQVITSAGEIRTRRAFLASVGPAWSVQRARRGAGLRVLSETVTSPTLAVQLTALLHDLPEARWHQWEPLNRDAARTGARLAFGEAVETRHRLDGAQVVLSLDADFLACGPSRLRLARELARRRRPPDMTRLYVVESTPSTTGAVADHRLPLRASDVEAVARAVAAGVGVRGRPAAPVAAEHRQWIEAVVRDLLRHRGTSAVIAGDGQPPAVHALAHAMNLVLGNAGHTVEYTDPVEAQPTDHGESLRVLAADMAAGHVELLLVLGGNPVYSAPGDVAFAEQMARVPLRVHLGLYEDETAQLCHWHVPEAHFLESWGDVRAHDGTVSIVQPLIAPLYGGTTAHELLSTLAGPGDRSSYDVVREHWQGEHAGADFATFWRRSLHDGVVPGTALAPKRVALRPDWDAPPPAPAAVGDGLEVVFRPDAHVFDGRFANNGWLQELPRPLTKLTWDNAALVAPATAERLGLASEDVVELRYRGRSVTAPVWILPGQAPDTVTLPLGFGRVRAGAVGTGVGFDAYRLRTADAPWFGGRLVMLRTGARLALACTQEHQSMEGREPARVLSLEELLAGAHVDEAPPGDLTLYPPHAYDGHAWAMAIDLTACIGCNACTIACQAENNIAVVGKDQVARGREMHWIRVDRYFAGSLDAPAIVHQPVPCMHCENAPCEVVCPVNATVHSSEGLNDMVYNRCVGTRYCSNNCPYKVRRFNFYLYSDWTTETLKMARNPNVTVRSRGVMEKCTYCVQRIERVRIAAGVEGRSIRDGEIVTACQQACPTEAIVFGDMNDPASRVARLRADARSYGLLAELNTRPRTTYLAAVRNPNREIDG